ncbi:MAG: hypothetical protein ACFCUQ_06735 [Kiloniellales bacterium]
MKSIVVLGLSAIALTACMGREPNPVAVQSERDHSLSCLVLEAEREGNWERLRYLRREQDGSEDMNIVVGSFAAAVFPPALVATDVSDAEVVEMRALRQRNDHIENLRVVKGCITEPLVPQGYTAVERGQDSFQDAEGRTFSLRSSTYIYGRAPATAVGAPAQQVDLTDTSQN